MTSAAPIPAASENVLESLKGAELTTVLVWKFGVSLSFNDGPLGVTIESNAEFHAQGRAELYQQDTIVAFGARMLPLIGRHVIDIRLDGDRTLAVSFDDGSTLAVRPDKSGYESYQMRFADKYLVG